MKKTMVSLSYNLYAHCPNCEEYIDIMDSEQHNDDDMRITHPLFNNKWDEIIGIDVICPLCEKEFEIERIEF